MIATPHDHEEEFSEAARASLRIVTGAGVVAGVAAASLFGYSAVEVLSGSYSDAVVPVAPAVLSTVVSASYLGARRHFRRLLVQGD